MSLKILTTDDLMDFKLELFEKIQELLKDQKLGASRRWLRSADVMDQLQISPSTLLNLRDNGTLPYSKIGELFFYDAFEIEKVMEDSKISNQG